MSNKQELPPLPKPRLYCHELIENKQFNPETEGVWLGCSEFDVVKLAHIEGQTGDEILSLYTPEQMRDYARAAQAATPAPAPLTDEQAMPVVEQWSIRVFGAASVFAPQVMELVRAIERAHGIGGDK